MISKFTAGLVVAVALIVSAPQTVLAASSNKSQITKNLKALNALPNGAAPFGKVSKYVKKLAGLDPKKAKKYYTIGLKKLPVVPGASKKATTLANQVTTILKSKKSGLTPSEIKKFSGQVKTELTKYEKKVSPYQAFVPSGLVGAMA